MSIDYRPRVSVEVTHEQATAIRALIPWGLRNQLFTIIIDDIIRLARKLGPDFISAILVKAIPLEAYLSVNLKGGEQLVDDK